MQSWHELWRIGISKEFTGIEREKSDLSETLVDEGRPVKYWNIKLCGMRVSYMPIAVNADHPLVVLKLGLLGGI